MKNIASRVGGNTFFSRVRAKCFRPARSCTHFAAEVCHQISAPGFAKRFSFKFAASRVIVPVTILVALIVSVTIVVVVVVAMSCPCFEKCRFRVHEKRLFEKSSVSSRREHQFYSCTGHVFFNGLNFHAFGCRGALLNFGATVRKNTLLRRDVFCSM